MSSFADLFGHEAAIGALRRALDSNTLAGTYLFVGAAGVGKGALAQAFAQAAACISPRYQPFDACGSCDSCRRVKSETHPDIVTIAPAGEQTLISQFWDRDSKSTPGVLSRTLSYAPTIARRRVYIVTQADTLTESAANSLLKVLEEPPPYVVFLLLASHSARVLPTIVSRSQIVRLNSAPVDSLAAYLPQRLTLDADRAAMLAAYTEGRIGQAIRMAQNPAVGEEIARILDFAEGLAEAPRVRALKAAEQMRKLSGQVKALVGEEAATANETPADTGDASPKERVGRKQLATVFDLLIAFYRDLLALRIGGVAAQSIVNRDRLPKMTRMAQSGGPERWVRCLDALLLARRRLDANANIALVTEALAMKLLAP